MHRSRSLEPMRPKRKFRDGAAPLSRKTFRRLPSAMEDGREDDAVPFYDLHESLDEDTHKEMHS